MWDMILKLGILALLPIFAAIAFFGAYFFFYQGSYEPPPSVDIPFQQLTSPAVPPSTFADTPTALVERGLVVVDAQHRNAFYEDEISSLLSRIASRGYDVEYAGDFGFADSDSRMSDLEEKLRRADSYLVILPIEAYADAEAAVVERFVRKGGRLLLVADPTRPHQINTLSQRFGLDFQPDYLYNLKEYDLNFQNILVRDFQPDELTTGLNSITMYAAGSIRSSGPGLAFVDANTQSAVVAGSEVLSPIALGSNRNVLAVGDFTFLVPPYNSLLDNNQLLSNIADFLTTSERQYELADFPYFYEGGLNDSVDILLGQASLLSIGVQMKNGLEHYNIPSQVSGAEDVSRDMVFLGLYEDGLQVSQYLQAAGLRVDDTLGTPFTPELDLEGTSITVLDQSQDRHALVILADTPESLSDAVGSLILGGFRGNLVSDFVGVRN